MIKKDKYTTNDFLIDNMASVGPDASVAKVFQIMRKEKIRHIPVVEDHKPIGIISDRDVKFVAHATGVVEMKAKEIMSRDVFSIKEGGSIKEAILTMHDRKIGSTIICDSEGKLVGIITLTDALRMLAENME